MAKIDELRALFEAALREEYLRGRRDERADILAELAGPTLEPNDVPAPSEIPRVAHGTIRPVVESILSRHRGLTAAEVGRRAKAVNSEIAETSVANELRRNDIHRPDRSKGRDLYRRDGERWYLAEDRLPETEAATPAVNGSSPPFKGRGDHGAALADL